jgi:hypothetical protein
VAWDSSRPVPWTRLTREWVIYAGIMAVVFALFFRGSGLVGAIAGLIASLPLYLGLGAALAKLGYERKALRQLRSERRQQAKSAQPDASPGHDAPRPRPQPTKRTSSTGSNRPRSTSKRRR